MNRTREEYENGLALGHKYAEADRANCLSLATNAHELRTEATETLRQATSSPRVIAFKLGIVRGYRMSIRTFERGRWGT